MESKQKTKKQLIQEALEASMNSEWETAIALNDEILNRYPREAEALNRKGRAYIELRQLVDAREAYTEALKADPANMIARRNLQRLELLHNRAEGSPEGVGATSSIIPRAAVFIEEAGRTWFDELTSPAELGKLAEVTPGDKLDLVVENDRVYVKDDDGSELGQIEIHVGMRIINAINAGHEFEVYALGMTAQTLRVIVRETHRPEDASGMPTFDRQDFASQDLMREREQLFLREEGDFDFGDDEEIEEIEDEDPELDTDGAADEDASDYVDSSVMEDDEPEEM